MYVIRMNAHFDRVRPNRSPSFVSASPTGLKEMFCIGYLFLSFDFSGNFGLAQQVAEMTGNTDISN